MTTKHRTIHVQGTHCAACKLLIEETLLEEPSISQANVSLKEETVTLETSIEDQESLLEHLNTALSVHGYTFTNERVAHVASQKREWLYAFIVVLLALGLFAVLYRTDLGGLIALGGGSYLTPILVGVVASLSTCLAVVGGLVLSVSATFAHGTTAWKPQVLFHGGRLGGFLLLGAGLGALGGALQIGIYGSQVLSVIASVVMLVLGVHLLEVTKRIRSLTLPAGIGQWFTRIARKSGNLAPVLLGAVTFFLPCGFTQSMQIQALSSGSLVEGALTMFLFSLGTLPVLGLLSLSSVDLAKSRYRGIFFKTAGLLVILFALYNIVSALRVLGIIP
jgi:sulfite exporter TauE/SafE/copper chaperone CopZ